MTEDNDLVALREFRSALDDPRDGGLARGRYQLARTDSPAPRRRRQWVLASAGAAVAVAVVVGGATFVNSAAGPRSDPSNQVAGQGPGSPASSDKADKDLPVTQGTRAPVNPAVTGIGGATHAKAVAALDRLATAAAGTQPVEIGAGKVLYVKTYNLQDGDGRYIHEIWQDVATATVLRIRRTDGADTNIDERSAQAEIDQSAGEPASLYHPVPAYYNGLPTDPAALLAAWRQWSNTTYPGRDADGMIWKDVYELLHYSEPFWTPQTRAAIYKAFGQMPAVKGTTATIGGTQYDVICMVRPGTGTGAGECLLFDSASGRYAGSAGTGTDMVVKQNNFEFVDFGFQPRPEAGQPQPQGSKKAGSNTGGVPTGKVPDKTTTGSANTPTR
jgi:hypothetical protein